MSTKSKRASCQALFLQKLDSLNSLINHKASEYTESHAVLQDKIIGLHNKIDKIDTQVEELKKETVSSADLIQLYSKDLRKAESTIQVQGHELYNTKNDIYTKIRNADILGKRRDKRILSAIAIGSVALFTIFRSSILRHVFFGF